MENSHSNTHKWSILIVVTLATFINNLDSSIVIIGLPKIMQGINLTMTTGLLVITAYIISSTVLILPAGKDKRITLVYITQKGILLFDKLIPLVNKHQEGTVKEPF